MEAFQLSDWGYAVLTLGLLATFLFLLFGKNLGAIASLVIMFICLGIMEFGASSTFRATNNGEVRMNNDCEERCPAGNTLQSCRFCPNNGSTTSEAASTGATDSGGGVVYVAPSGGADVSGVTVAVATTTKITVPANGLSKWLLGVVTRPLSDPGVGIELIPAGVVCAAKCTKCDMATKTNEVFDWGCDDQAHEGVVGITFQANGWFSRSMGVPPSGEVVEIKGTGDWQVVCDFCTFGVEEVVTTTDSATTVPVPVPAPAAVPPAAIPTCRSGYPCFFGFGYQLSNGKWIGGCYTSADGIESDTLGNPLIEADGGYNLTAVEGTGFSCQLVP